MHRIRKGQFGLGRLGVQGRLAPAVWNAVRSDDIVSVFYGAIRRKTAF
jgi:hypothetical protein